MTDRVFALLDANNVVVNTIVADPEFITSLPEMVKNSKLNSSSALAASKIHDVTDKVVGIGHQRSASGEWVPPKPISPSKEELDAIAAQKAEDARIQALRAKVGPGKPGLTQAERDELHLIMINRGVISG